MTTNPSTAGLNPTNIDRLVSPLHALRPHCVPPYLLFILDRQRNLTIIHKYIVPHTPLFYCTGHNFGRLTREHVTTPRRHHKHGYHRYLWDFLHHIYSGDNWCGGWQLMWPFMFGRSGLWPFRFVAVPACGRSGLWPFWFVAVPVCGHFGLWPFRSVAFPVCGRIGLWPFRFVAVSVVAVSVCGRYDLLPGGMLGYGPDTIFVRKPIDEVPATFSKAKLVFISRATRHAV